MLGPRHRPGTGFALSAPTGRFRHPATFSRSADTDVNASDTQIFRANRLEACPPGEGRWFFHAQFDGTQTRGRRGSTPVRAPDQPNAGRAIRRALRGKRAPSAGQAQRQASRPDRGRARAER